MVAFAVAASPSYAAGGIQGITIDGSNGGFSACGCATGSGTASDPYVIGPFAIMSPNSLGSAITIENITADMNIHFTITGISVNYNDTNPLDRGNAVIHLSNVTAIGNPDHVSNVTANDDGTGVEIDSHSSNVALDSISVNKMNGAGLVIRQSSYISTSNGKYKATSDGQEANTHFADGLYAVGSDHLTIGGVPKCPQGVCNTFDYDSGWGVYLENTSNVLIDQASANADDTGGFVLDGSLTHDVTIENSTAEAGGPICTTQMGGKAPTGYAGNIDLVGGLMMVNNTHNNTLINDTFNGTSASSGYSIAGTGNPFYFNPCSSTQIFNPAPVGPSGHPDTAMAQTIWTSQNFSNVCYTRTNPSNFPPSSCKS